MKIAKFEKLEFGELTTIMNEKSGKVMFIAKEVGTMWGHTNMKQVVSRILNKSEYLIIKKSEYPKFFEPLVSNGVLPTKAQRIQLVTESGLYKLALSSNLEKAKPFRDWVTEEVLPAIRKKGSYSIIKTDQNLLSHTNVGVQKENSKDVNSKNYRSGGVDKIIEYNREPCILHTGKTPSEIKQAGKDLGLKSTQRTSAKEVLRNVNKPLACTMSFTDQLVAQGYDLKQVSELALKAALPLFDGMIKLGVIPKELED